MSLTDKPTFYTMCAREYHSTRLVSTCVFIQWLRFAGVVYGYPIAYSHLTLWNPMQYPCQHGSLWITCGCLCITCG